MGHSLRQAVWYRLSKPPASAAITNSRSAGRRASTSALEAPWTIPDASVRVAGIAR